MEPIIDRGDQRMIARADLDDLLGAIARRGFRLIGPTLSDGAIIYDDIASAADLPAGWTDEQDGGHYRVHRRDDEALFGYAVGPQSWKRYLFPATSLLWRSGQEAGGDAVAGPPMAFIGVRACELRAIAIQDRVFLEGQQVDPVYASRRAGAFLVAVNCGTAAGTCFCVSMQAGPKAESGFDLALTELMDGGRHEFLVEAGTSRGADVLAEVASRAADGADARAAAQVTERTAASMGRQLDTRGIKDLLYDNFDHPRWDDVASRCLTCGNCTMVCPTCFCFSITDVNDLAGDGGGAAAVLGFLLHPGPLLRARRLGAGIQPLPVPAVDDAQARHLDRPVRHLGLRRLRPLHHLVPGRHRHHRRGRRHPRPGGRHPWRHLSRNCATIGSSATCRRST